MAVEARGIDLALTQGGYIEELDRVHQIPPAIRAFVRVMVERVIEKDQSWTPCGHLVSEETTAAVSAISMDGEMFEIELAPSCLGMRLKRVGIPV